MNTNIQVEEFLRDDYREITEFREDLPTIKTEDALADHSEEFPVELSEELLYEMLAIYDKY